MGRFWVTRDWNRRDIFGRRKKSNGLKNKYLYSLVKIGRRAAGEKRKSQKKNHRIRQKKM
jgi:hypothetical protein